MSETLATRAEPIAPAEWSCWFSLGPGDPFPAVPEWESLSARYCATPFATAYWHRCWWQNLARPSDRLLVYRFTTGCKTEAVVPLLARGRLVRGLSPPFDPHTPVWDVACTEPSPKLFESLIRRLEASTDRIVLFSAVPGDLLYAAVIEGAERCGAMAVERLDCLETYIDMTLCWEAYLAGRDKKVIQNYARKERQLARLGRLQYCDITSDPHLKEILRECYAVEQASWKGKCGSAIADQPATESFYTQLAIAASSAGALSLKTLRLDGRLLAFDLDLRHGTEMFALKIGVDPEFSKYSPGHVLMYTMVQRLQDTGLTRLRLGPPSAWKATWTDRVQPLSVVEIIPNHARARALYWLGPGLRRSLKRRLKRLPMATVLAERLRRKRRRSTNHLRRASIRPVPTKPA